MAKSKKQKIHALKKKSVAPNPTTVEWTPKTVRKDMSNYIDHFLKQEGDKKHTVATHLTNVYRGLEWVSSSFIKSQWKKENLSILMSIWFLWISLGRNISS